MLGLVYSDPVMNENPFCTPSSGSYIRDLKSFQIPSNLSKYRACGSGGILLLDFLPHNIPCLRQKVIKARMRLAPRNYDRFFGYQKALCCWSCDLPDVHNIRGWRAARCALRFVAGHCLAISANEISIVSVHFLKWMKCSSLSKEGVIEEVKRPQWQYWWRSCPSIGCR